MAKVSKAQLIINIMNDNATLPMDEVLALIVTATKDLPGAAIDTGRARAYYVYNYRKGIASGVGPGSEKRPRAPKAAKAPKAPRAKIVKVPAPRIAGDREKSAVNKNLTVEEMNDIKAKTMARMKAVAAKYSKGQYAEPRFSDEPFDATAVPKLERELDSFDAPKFLKMKDVKALV